MQTWFECIPCFARQAVESVGIVTPDKDLQEQLLREILRELSEMNLQESPPAMAQRVHALLRRRTGIADPYRELKRAHNELALKMLPAARQRVAEAPDPLEAALRLAAAGNLIDMGVGLELDDARIRQTIDDALSVPLYNTVAGVGPVGETMPAQIVRLRTRAADSVLFLADNAGEIVFDRLLVEQLGHDNLTVAVKGGPIINDATIEDAREAGIDRLAPVIANGFDAPGTILEHCSEEFLEAWHNADFVIAKGQGNFETLNEADKPRAHVLTAKCAVVARLADWPRGGMGVYFDGFDIADHYPC